MVRGHCAPSPGSPQEIRRRRSDVRAGADRLMRRALDIVRDLEPLRMSQREFMRTPKIFPWEPFTTGVFRMQIGGNGPWVIVIRNSMDGEIHQRRPVVVCDNPPRFRAM